MGSLSQHERYNVRCAVKMCISRCFTSVIRYFTRKVTDKRIERRRRKGRGKETTDARTTPIKAETIQVQARWPTSSFEIEALSAMHLRYTRERKRRGCGKGKGAKKVEQMTSIITTAGLFPAKRYRCIIASRVSALAELQSKGTNATR